MKTDKSLLKLLKESDWQHFFKMCCESGVTRLEAQAWQFQEELAAKRLDDVQDALFDLARELMPESPAANKAAYEDWAGGLLRQMFNLLHERGLEVPDGEDADRIDEAYATGARVLLRAAVRGYTMKAIEARRAA